MAHWNVSCNKSLGFLILIIIAQPLHVCSVFLEVCWLYWDVWRFEAELREFWYVFISLFLKVGSCPYKLNLLCTVAESCSLLCYRCCWFPLGRCHSCLWPMHKGRRLWWSISWCFTENSQQLHLYKIGGVGGCVLLYVRCNCFKSCEVMILLKVFWLAVFFSFNIVWFVWLYFFFYTFSLSCAQNFFSQGWQVLWMPPSVSTLKPLLTLARAALGAVTFNHSTKPWEKAPHESHILTHISVCDTGEFCHHRPMFSSSLSFSSFASLCSN